MMRTQLPQARQKLDAHPGLMLQRYVAHPADGSTRWQHAKGEIQDAARTAIPCDLYKAAYERWKQSLPELTAANDLQTVGRLIVGLGTENVLETGIRLHHIYGMPILPGSALKGLAAHYCHTIWGENEPKFKNDGNYHQLLFGTTDESGCIVFHDGWFVPDSDKEPLKLDVMTPHHPKWLDGSVPPTDFDSPTPVPFLSVSGKFYVAVSWYGPEDYEKSIAWTKMAFELALAGLTDWGIGGKTTSGYGRMTEPDPGKRKKPFSASALGLPAVGSIAEATLLDAPKKDKPWRAKVQLRGGKELSGPIEGVAPGAPKTGQTVRLVVIEIGENKIRYQWPLPAKK
jgi:CRISPR type III-B/RAMP module RAMP protein Cmr6